MANPEFHPIGQIKVPEVYPAESPRQPKFASQTSGYLELNPNLPIESLQGLDEFSHIWIVFVFHRNSHWSPMIQPPRSDITKKGVLATRAPYRPNPIGVSAVAIDRVDGRRIYFGQHDFLDGTPVLDVKPYIPEYDSLPQANSGWVTPVQLFDIEFSAHSLKQLSWLSNKGLHLESVIHTQLSSEPDNTTRKRIKRVSDDLWQLAFRTWRINFRLFISKRQVEIELIDSGYSSGDLESPIDPYGDKSIHSQFQQMNFS